MNDSFGETEDWAELLRIERARAEKAEAERDAFATRLKEAEQALARREATDAEQMARIRDLMAEVARLTRQAEAGAGLVEIQTWAMQYQAARSLEADVLATDGTVGALSDAREAVDRCWEGLTDALAASRPEATANCADHECTHLRCLDTDCPEAENEEPHNE